jgi:uncharacterized protein YdhG (YjbR/CyaY superfamily)
MVSKAEVPKTVDEYISGFPPEVRAKLEKLRVLIKKTVPGIEERISYKMPGYFLGGYLVYFAAYPRHIGFYALPGAMVAFKERLGPYKKAKGSVQFPIDEELPYDLIRDILIFRVKENADKAAAKKKAAPKKKTP